MKKHVLLGVVLASGAAWAAEAPKTQAPNVQDGPPPWAWGYTTPAPPGPPTEFTPQPPAAPLKADDPKHTLPGSKFSFSRGEANNRYAPADWFPEDHPAMPPIVSHGRENANPTIYACALCHMPNGHGRPENAAVNALPYDYILRQLEDFKAGHRRSSDPRKTNTSVMESFTRAMTEDEMKQAAAYFAAIPATPWIKVVESATVPKTRTAGGVFFALEGKEAGTEPLGARIIEMPLNNDDFEKWRNPHSGFVAYVPQGSVAKGKALVTTGGGKTTACTVCHGADLRGLGPVPRLANRSPSYVARQLYDMQHGNRIGAWMPLMAPVIEKLTPDDVLNISAYLASLEP
ncbi:MAG: c-type cytochrome [Rhodospirillaceae bacterium]|nr:c-type cytochrome [Rhodospirillaceae bacterium]